MSVHRYAIIPNSKTRRQSKRKSTRKVVPTLPGTVSFLLHLVGRWHDPRAVRKEQPERPEMLDPESVRILALQREPSEYRIVKTVHAEVHQRQHPASLSVHSKRLVVGWNKRINAAHSTLITQCSSWQSLIKSLQRIPVLCSASHPLAH